ncbi:MAG TPA: MlaD family protein [Candidatus Sulfotelmatobacter sp.]|nr:MlaD family protein [Candidatus Sulfotelmatobacter sp.]
MARRVSPTLIGAFVVGAVALGVAAVLVLAGQHWFQRPITCVMAFDDSVAGLSVGAPVRYRGVPLGTVSDIQLRYGNHRIVVVTKIDPARIEGMGPAVAATGVGRTVQIAVDQGLRAQLQLESLITGQLYVGLDFYPETAAPRPEAGGGECEIPTIPSTLAQFQEQMKKLFTDLGQLPLKQTLAAVERAGDAIQQVAASPEIPRVLRSADQTMKEIQTVVHGVGVKLDPTIDALHVTLDQAQRTMDTVGQDVHHLVQNVDGRVGPLADSVAGAAESTQALMRSGQQTLARLDAEIAPTAASVRQAAEAARAALQRAETALDQVGGVLSGDSPLGYQLADALEELTRAARTFRSFSEDLERQPNLLLFGRGGSSK